MREKNFPEMYRALGSREKQEEIREVNSDETHCKLLMESPMSCESLPKDIGNATKGSVCPNNPLFRHKDLYKHVRRYETVFANFEYLERLVQLGALPSLDEMTPEEAEAALILKQYLDAMNSAQLQTAMAAPMQALGSFLGGGGKGGRQALASPANTRKVPMVRR